MVGVWIRVVVVEVECIEGFKRYLKDKTEIHVKYSRLMYSWHI